MNFRYLLKALCFMFCVYSNTYASETHKDLLKTATFKAYLESLLWFQNKNPGVYTPPEFIRFDLIEYRLLWAEINRGSKPWIDLKNKKLGTDKTLQEQRRISVENNERLWKILQSATKSQKPLYGSTQFYIDLVPLSHRIALTPFDSLFKQSDLGRKIFSDLKESPESFLIQTEKKKIIFTSNTKSYEVSILSKPDSKDLIFKTKQANNQSPIGSDLKMNKNYLRGSLFGSEKWNDLSSFPFGTLPKQKETWLDESGKTHFGGDGHAGCSHP